MQKIDKQILKYLLSVRHGDDYEIITLSELKEYLSINSQIEDSVIFAAIEYLADEEYISLKYSDKIQFCLKATIKGKNYFQNGKNYLRLKKHIFIISFCGGFLGAFFFFCLFFGIKSC